MHFLDTDKQANSSKMALISAVVFVVTAIVGIGGGAQQFCVKFFDISPLFDLRVVSFQTFIIQLAFHLIPFAVGIGAIFFAAKKILGRSICTLFGNTNKIFKKISVVVLLYFLCFLGFLLFQKNDVTPNMLSHSFAWISLVLVIFVVIQIAFEELLFRAFLPQTLVGFGATKLIGICVSAVIFGVLHSGNPEVLVYGKGLVLLYIFHGLFLGFLTYFDNSIWGALGYHFINNFLALWFVSSDEQVLQVPSLYRVTTENHSLTLMTFQILVTTITIMIGGFVFFKWRIKVKK